MNAAAREIYSWLRSRGIRPESVTVILRANTDDMAGRLETELVRDQPPSCQDQAPPASGTRTFRFSGLRVMVTTLAASTR